MLGIELNVNFRVALLRAHARSEFWRRWHISLSTWLRDYLYIPLGGSRGTAWRTRRNCCVTMVLGGLWHGAAGRSSSGARYQGLLLVADREVRTRWTGAVPRARLGRRGDPHRELALITPTGRATAGCCSARGRSTRSRR